MQAACQAGGSGLRSRPVLPDAGVDRIHEHEQGEQRCERNGEAEQAPRIDSFVGQVRLRDALQVEVLALGIRRGMQLMLVPSTWERLQADDRLLLLGSDDALASLPKK